MQSKTLQKPKIKKYQDQTSDLVRAHTDKGPLDFKVPGCIQRYMPEPRVHLYSSTSYSPDETLSAML